MMIARSVRLGRFAVTAIVLGLLAVSCSSHPAPAMPGTSPRAGHESASGVLALHKMSTLRVLFNRADGHPRLVLILSPT
jgi:hypothetical protein